MTNKYYTPSIEEFKVGFRYEFHGMTTGGLTFFNGDETTKKYEKEPDIKIWTEEIYNPLPDDTMITEEWYIGTVTYPKSLGFYCRSLKEIEKLIESGQIRAKKDSKNGEIV